VDNGDRGGGCGWSAGSYTSWEDSDFRKEEAAEVLHREYVCLYLKDDCEEGQKGLSKALIEASSKTFFSQDPNLGGIRIDCH
jgi:hypothetical protein